MFHVEHSFETLRPALISRFFSLINADNKIGLYSTDLFSLNFHFKSLFLEDYHNLILIDYFKYSYF